MGKTLPPRTNWRTKMRNDWVVVHRKLEGAGSTRVSEYGALVGGEGGVLSAYCETKHGTLS